MNTDLTKMKNGELFQHFVSLHQPIVPIRNQSYTLYEDLSIIVSLQGLSQIQSKHFKDLEEKKIIYRTYNSIKNRYLDYLSNLTQDDCNEIANHLKSIGIEGYIQFTNNKPHKFLKISNTDPKTLVSEKKKVEEELEQNIEIKKVKQEKKIIDNTYPKNDFDKFPLEDLDQILDLLAATKQAPKAYIVERLHQLSGNLEDLDLLLKTNDETHCFLEEEDELLKRENNKQSPALRLLIRKKGLHRVQRRLRYLSNQSINT